MKTKLFRGVILLFLAVFALGIGALNSEAAENFFDMLNPSEESDGHYTMKDRADSAVILRTARILHPGDSFIDEENRHFRVVSIEGRTAWAEQTGSESASPGDLSGPLSPASGAVVPKGQNDKPRIGIYHTHGAESYVPTDGTDTIDQGGGILQVGDSFTRALQEKGYPVNHIREPHTPHDAGAYQRSRRTAEELITEGDQLIFDVHRDAVPPEEYENTVNGEEVTRIMLVVGQQNQNADNNRSFAADLKNIADEEHPGLIKGILGAQGNYNQDLTPRAILLEVGAHENSREDAERAVTLFADIVDDYVTGSSAAPGPTAAPPDRLSLASVLKVILLLAAGLFVYLLIAAGSWSEMKRKVADFFQREFADLRAPWRRDNDEEGW